MSWRVSQWVWLHTVQEDAPPSAWPVVWPQVMLTHLQQIDAAIYQVSVPAWCCHRFRCQIYSPALKKQCSCRSWASCGGMGSVNRKIAKLSYIRRHRYPIRSWTLERNELILPSFVCCCLQSTLYLFGVFLCWNICSQVRFYTLMFYTFTIQDNIEKQINCATLWSNSGTATKIIMNNELFCFTVEWKNDQCTAFRYKLYSPKLLCPC